MAATTPNVLIYATSNRRHLLPEYMAENLSYTPPADGEVHPGEVVEEKISSPERFGLWISFYPFSQEEYLRIVEQWLTALKVPTAAGNRARRPWSGRLNGITQWTGGLAVCPGLRGSSRCMKSRMNAAVNVLMADPGIGRLVAGERLSTDVAVGVLIRPDDAFLLTTRPVGKGLCGILGIPWRQSSKQANPWKQALKRELLEEIGLDIGAVQRWRTQIVDYPHALVRLHFAKVYAWSGELEMREGQRYHGAHLPVTVEPVLPGAVPVLKWLSEPGLDDEL